MQRVGVSKEGRTAGEQTLKRSRQYIVDMTPKLWWILVSTMCSYYSYKSVLNNGEVEIVYGCYDMLFSLKY